MVSLLNTEENAKINLKTHHVYLIDSVTAVTTTVTPTKCLNASKVLQHHKPTPSNMRTIQKYSASFKKKNPKHGLNLIKLNKNNIQ